MKKITLTSKIGRDPNILHSTVDGEIVMVSIDKGKHFGLDEVGSRIWDFIEKPLRISTIIELLVKEYNVEYEDCQKDVIQFTEQMLSLQIVDVTND